MSKKDYLTKLTVKIHPEDEEIILTAIQEQLGYQANIYSEPLWNDEEVEIYAPIIQKEALIMDLTTLLSEFIELEFIHPLSYNITTIEIQEEDWMHHWKKYFTPILVGQKLQITPFWYENNPERVNLILEPKMGFGTGQHATTFLCLEYLEKEDLSNKTILDLGAGSGILGVAALLLGAKHSTLLEIDILSIESCQDTAQRNHVSEKVDILHQDVFFIEDQYKKPYDIAAINIIAEVIVDILALSWLKQTPILYLSGILEGKKEKVYQAIIENGWKLVEEKQLKEWILLKVINPAHNR